MEATVLGRRRKKTTARRRFFPSSGGSLRLESQGDEIRHAYDPDPLGAAARQKNDIHPIVVYVIFSSNLLVLKYERHRKRINTSLSLSFSKYVLKLLYTN